MGNRISTCKRIKLNLLPHIRYKIDSKRMIRLNVTAKTIMLLDKNLGVILHDLGLDNRLLRLTTKYIKQKKKDR